MHSRDISFASKFLFPPRYAYLPPTPEVRELWKDAKALGPEYLLSPDGQAELRTETSLSALRLHVFFAHASTETLKRTPNCSWLNREASYLRQLSQHALESLTLSALSSSLSPSVASLPALEFSAFDPENSYSIREEFSPRFQHGYQHLPHVNKSITTTRVVVENLEQFQWNFQVFTQGIFPTNTSAVVSGSTVLACMYMGADKQFYERETKLREDFATLALPRDIRLLVGSYAFHPDPLMPYSSELYHALFSYYHLAVEWQESDVDVFLQVNSVEEAERQVRKLTDAYKAALPLEEQDKFAVLRTTTSITLVSRWPIRNMQIVLLLFPSVCGLLSCFDLDCVRLAYDLETRNVLVLPQAARAISTSVNLISPSLTIAWGRSTPYRIDKYLKRGFHMALFDLWPMEKTVRDLINAQQEHTIKSGSSISGVYVDSQGKPQLLRMWHTSPSKTPESYNLSSILMPPLSYTANSSLFPGHQKLRSPSKLFHPLPSPESRRERWSISSNGSSLYNNGSSEAHARRGSCGSEDSLSFHMPSDSPCPSPPLDPLLPPSIFSSTSTPSSSPRPSPPSSVYGGGSSPSFFAPPAHSPYGGFRPPIFNLAFPPRFSPPLAPHQPYTPYPSYSLPSSTPMHMHRPPFAYPSSSPYSPALYAQEQVSPHTPPTFVPFHPSPSSYPSPHPSPSYHSSSYPSPFATPQASPLSQSSTQVPSSSSLTSASSSVATLSTNTSATTNSSLTASLSNLSVSEELSLKPHDSTASQETTTNVSASVAASAADATTPSTVNAPNTATTATNAPNTTTATITTAVPTEETSLQEVNHSTLSENHNISSNDNNNNNNTNSPSTPCLTPTHNNDKNTAPIEEGDMKSPPVFIPPEDEKQSTVAKTALKLNSVLHGLFHITLHPFLEHAVALRKRVSLVSKKYDPKGLELPSNTFNLAIKYDRDWNSELTNLPYGPGVCSVNFVSEYVSLLQQSAIPIVYGPSLDSVWKEAATIDRTDLPWFRWKASDFDPDFVRHVLEKNV